MSTRIQNAELLLAHSWAIIKAEKSILTLPLAGVLCAAAAFALAALTLHLANQPNLAEIAPALWHHNPIPLLVGFLAYALSAFGITFFNTALISYFLRRLRNQPASISLALADARQRAGLILRWSLLLATVGILLRLLEDRTHNLGRFLLSFLLNVTFSLTSFLVVPILVAENKGPLDALKTSTRLLRKTWGEQLVGSLTLGFLFGMFYIIAAILIIFAVTAYFSANPTDPAARIIAIPLFLIGVLLLIYLSAIQSAIDALFRTTLYLFATENLTPAGFSPALLQDALRKPIPPTP